MSLAFDFDNSYARDLSGFYVPWQGNEVPAPQIIKLNVDLAAEIGLDASALATADGAAILAGSKSPAGSNPIAQAYAGHQFGGFSPQLGDGRGLLIGELIDRNGLRRDIHLKGSGPTPFARGGDGKAALGPVLREYIIGEAMQALGIPTTRALAAVATGEKIMRQDGVQPGAVFVRVAASHLRVGTFEFFSARNEASKLRQLADYTIARHHPELADSDTPYLGLLRAVSHSQSALIAQWMQVGFVHGVMNTDNTAISGETIDYGPCAFIDSYDPKAVFSSIDTGGRYALGNQPAMAHWNLSRFAETLLPLIDDNEQAAAELASAELDGFAENYQANWLQGMRAKLGLATKDAADFDLVNDLLTIMERQKVDFTLLFRRLSQALMTSADRARAQFEDPIEFDAWLIRWRSRVAQENVSVAERVASMDKTNPIVIPRNHLVEEALQLAVSAGDYSKFDRLLTVLATPYDENEANEEYTQAAPDNFGPYKTYCGT